MPESARAKIPGSWAGPHRSGAVVPNWIRNFGDPELTALVADAVERNPDLKAAAARVEASRAAVRIAASSLYPRIAMKGLGERQGQELSGDIGRDINPPSFGGPGTEDSGGAGLDTSTDSSSQRWVYGIAAGAAWEADVWGRIRSKKAAARAESYALEADYEFARQSLAAAVARAYFSTIEAAQQEANAQETLDIYQEYSKLTDERKQQGFASDFDVSQIKSRTAAAEDALYAAQAARAQTIRAIEVVTSRYPAGRFDVRRSFPGQPRSRARRFARANPRTPAGPHRQRAPFRRCLSPGERGAHRAPAALCAQRHERARNRGHSTESARSMPSSGVWPVGSRNRFSLAVNLRLRKISAPPSKKPPPQATWAPRCARSRKWKMLSPAITICANAKARLATQFRAVPIR